MRSWIFGFIFILLGSLSSLAAETSGPENSGLTALGSGGASCLFNFDFSHGSSENFQAVFRDLPLPIFQEYLMRKNDGESLGPVAPLENPPASYPEDQTHWLLNSGIFPLPSGLSGTGFLVQGDNHSDDLDMYLVRLMGPTEGFKPNSVYKVRVTVDLAGNAPSGASGVGGDPELRIQAVLNSSFNPTRYIIDEQQDVRHPQSLTRFPSAPVATNGVCKADPESSDPCPNLENIPYELKKGRPSKNLTIRTDSKGQFWLMVGSHSPFESFSGIYYTRIQLQVLQGAGFQCRSQ